MRTLPRPWTRGFLDLVWPPHCLACEAPTWEDAGLCALCAARIPAPISRCPRCGRPSGPYAAVDPCARCRRDDVGLEGVVAAWGYEGVPRLLVLALKYRHRLPAAWLLGTALGEALQGASLPGDLLVPVPLSRRRHRERGFNQAAELARTVASLTGIACEERALFRRRHAPPQVGQPRGRRRRGPRGAFVARTPLLEGRSILLVDDVYTTGGTARACATALRRARTASVVAAVACRT